MSDPVNYRRIFIAWALLALACLVSIWGSRWIVDLMYSGDLLPGVFTNRRQQPVEHYYRRVTPIVIGGVFFIGVLTTLALVRRVQSARVILVVLMVGDIILCALGETYGGPLSVRVDGGLPEWFQYFKEVSIAIVLFRVAKSTGHSVFTAWSFLFLFLFADDAFRYHEHAGAALGSLSVFEVISQRMEVRAVDIGELVSVAPLLGAFFLGITISYRREDAAGRRATITLAVLMGVLLFFGGVMDIVDRIATTRGSDLARPLSLIEDGGEMLTMSGILAYSLALFWDPKKFDLGVRRSA